MTQEMKLLMALTEALGFEVETTLDYQQRTTIISAADMPYRFQDERAYVTDGDGRIAKNDDGEYMTVLVSPIVDYKIKRRFGVFDKGEIK